MKALPLAAVVVIAGCASAPSPEEEEQARKALAARVDNICSLPPGQRDAELERLKKEAGVVLFCGASEDEKKPQ